MSARESGWLVRAAAPSGRPVSVATAARADQFLEREDLLDAAIHDGRISAGLRAHYAQCLDADPAGTKEYLRKLAPTHVSATAPPADTEEYPETWLTSAERARLQAARGGRPHSRIVS